MVAEGASAPPGLSGWLCSTQKTWMAGTSPAMTDEGLVS